MEILLIILHLAVCFILIAVVLLQSGKGADLASAFGGGSSQTALGARGATTLLSKITTGAAVLFMITSFSLAVLQMNKRGAGPIKLPPQGTQVNPAAATPAASASPAGGAGAEVVPPTAPAELPSPAAASPTPGGP